MNLTTYLLHVQSPVMGINRALTMVGVFGWSPTTPSSLALKGRKTTVSLPLVLVRRGDSVWFQEMCPFFLGLGF